MGHRRSGRWLAWLVGAAVVIQALMTGVASAGHSNAPDHSGYDALLRKYVTKNGVRYAAWRANDTDRFDLKRYIVQMENTPVDSVAATPAARRVAMAYWINLYNAATLDLIIQDYPVKSIKELGGGAGSPWKRDVTASGGHALSLDQIENEILRPKFQDPRVHFALNCAARSCPPLRIGAYVPDSLDTQLEEQTRSFLKDGRVQLLPGSAVKVRLPKIFDWYGEDFGATDGKVVVWLRPYVSDLAAVQDTAKVDLKYADYDWSLNEAKEP